MRIKMLIGIILIVLGIAAFVFQGITYTTQEDAIDFGPIHVTTEQTKTIPLPPVLGGIALIGGIALVILDNKKT